jgi:hypothetical protein
MAERRKRSGVRGEQPIPCEPVDLLAGIATGVELAADDPPPAGEDDSATLTVAEVGRMLRSEDDTIRRLIRKARIEPSPAASEGDVRRAGVPPRTRTRPGE